MTLSQICTELDHSDQFDLIIPEDVHPSQLVLDAMMDIDNRIDNARKHRLSLKEVK